MKDLIKKIKYYFNKDNPKKWYFDLPVKVFIFIFWFWILTFSWGIWVVLAYYVLKIIVMIYFWFNNNFIKKIITLNNTHLFGSRRKGKDLIMQLSIIKRFVNKDKKIRKNLKRKIKKEEIWKEYTYELSNNMLKDKLFINFVLEKELEKYYEVNPNYLSNIDYGYGAKVIKLSELKLVDNKTKKELDYNDIITGAYEDMDIIKRDDFEGLDLYVSDAQLYLPNTEHNRLDRYYPSLPVFFSLAGQLYNMNITVNTQEYERLWVKLRGQQDAYVKALKTIPINKSILQKIWSYIPVLKKYLFVKIRYFENQQAAENNLLPFKGLNAVGETTKPVYLTSGTAIKEQHEATYGKIKDKLLVIKIKDIKYDTRVFHKLIFGYDYD